MQDTRSFQMHWQNVTVVNTVAIMTLSILVFKSSPQAGVGVHTITSTFIHFFTRSSTLADIVFCIELLIPFVNVLNPFSH